MDQRKKDYDEKNPKIYIDHFFNMIGKPAKVGPTESDVYTVDETDVVAMGAVIVITGILIFLLIVLHICR